MTSHAVGGRKLSRKQGPRLALYKNLIVSVLRYERIQTTEAKHFLFQCKILSRNNWQN